VTPRCRNPAAPWLKAILKSRGFAPNPIAARALAQARTAPLQYHPQAPA
jgi:hypothetical protein